MKFTVIALLVASVSAIRIDGPAKNTWNYASTGGHTGVNRLPNAPNKPIAAPFTLGGAGIGGTPTGTISTP